MQSFALALFIINARFFSAAGIPIYGIGNDVVEGALTDSTSVISGKVFLPRVTKSNALLTKSAFPSALPTRDFLPSGLPTTISTKSSTTSVPTTSLPISTLRPRIPSNYPSRSPTTISTKSRTSVPTSSLPTSTIRPSIASNYPSRLPTIISTKSRTSVPTSSLPISTIRPSIASNYPSRLPTTISTKSRTSVPTSLPISKIRPSISPSCQPSAITKNAFPSAAPSLLSSSSISGSPSSTFSKESTKFPTRLPISTADPRIAPSFKPFARSINPTFRPTISTSTGAPTETNQYAFNSLLSVSSTQSASIDGGNAGVKKKPSTASTRAPSSKLRPGSNPSTSPTTRPTLSEDITYHNNQSVMTGTVQVYNIFLGDYSSAVSKNSTFLVNNLASKLGNTSWYNILSNHYYQFQNGVKTYISKSLVFNRHVVWQQASMTAVTERHFIQVIIDKFNTAELPLDDNGIYTIFFRGNIANNPTLTVNGVQTSWLTDWCGYHGAFRLRGISTVIKFAVVGDPTSSSDPNLGPKCYVTTTGTSPNGNLGGDSMANLFANQIANVVTNPTSSTWYIDKAGSNEVGTSCNWKYGTYSGNSNVVVGSKAYLLQQLWVPRIGCVLSA